MESEKVERKEFIKLLKDFVNDILNTFPEAKSIFSEKKTHYSFNEVIRELDENALKLLRIYIRS